MKERITKLVGRAIQLGKMQCKRSNNLEDFTMQDMSQLESLYMIVHNETQYLINDVARLEKAVRDMSWEQDELREFRELDRLRSGGW